MKPYEHAAVSLVIGTAVLICFKSIACGLASFLAGVFLDVDHIADYLFNHGPTFRVKEFYDYCMEIRFEKLSLVFHSYEIVIALWAAIILMPLGAIWKAVAIGITQHIILDQARNMSLGKMDWRTYFFIFRLKKGFRVKEIVKKR